jgi:hypothetical protein
MVMGALKILPGTGRWQHEVLTEGVCGMDLLHFAGPLHHAFGAVPLRVPGRIS